MGKIENILQEEEFPYNVYSVGDIIFVKRYQYENGKEGHNHLFVIIDQNNIAVPIENNKEYLRIKEIIKRNEFRIEKEIKEIDTIEKIDFSDIFPTSEQHIKTKWGDLKFVKIRYFDENKLNWEAAPDFVVKDWNLLKTKTLEDKRYTFIQREKWDAIEFKTENSLVYFLNPLITEIYGIK